MKNITEEELREEAFSGVVSLDTALDILRERDDLQKQMDALEAVLLRAVGGHDSGAVAKAMEILLASKRRAS